MEAGGATAGLDGARSRPGGGAAARAGGAAVRAVGGAVTSTGAIGRAGIPDPAAPSPATGRKRMSPPGSGPRS